VFKTHIALALSNRWEKDTKRGTGIQQFKNLKITTQVVSFKIQVPIHVVSKLDTTFYFT